MKPILLISAFLFTPTVWADPRIFYASVNAKVEGVSYIDLPKESTFFLYSSPVHPASTFNLDKEGVVTIKIRNTIKVMGISESNNLVIGDYSEVTPFKVQLDKDSRVSNLHPQVCQCVHNENGYSGVLMSPRSPLSKVKCIPSDIYLISPGEPKPGSAKKSLLSKLFSDFWEGVKEDFRSPKPISDLESSAEYGRIWFR